MLAENCDCEQYRHLVGTSSLGSEVAEIGTSVLHQQEGGTFAGSDEQRMISRLGADAYRMIPARCRDYLIGGLPPRLTFSLRGMLESGTRDYADSEDTPNKLLGAYDSMVRDYTSPDCTSPSDNSYAANSAYRRCTFDHFRRESAGLSPSELKQRYLSQSGLSNGDVSVIQAYDAVLNAGSGQAALDYLSGLKNKLTTDQKLTLVQMFGTRFDRDYDHSREKGGVGESVDNVVPLDKLLEAGRKNTIGESTDGTPAVAGVCRDIATAQGQMLEKLGFKNTYVIAQVDRSGAYHVTVITQDPEYSNLYRLNYGKRNDPAGGDSRSLNMGYSDVSINYRVFKPGNRQVADIQSDFGKFLTEAAGFDIRDIDPLAQPHGSMAAANLALGRRLGTQLRGGMGTDGTGATYGFGAVTQTWGDGGYFPGKVGLVLGTQVRDAIALGDPGQKTVNMDLVYVQLEQKFRTPELTLAPDVQARIEATATAIFQASRVRGGSDDGSVNVQGDLRVSAQARVEQGSWKDRVRSTYVVGAQASPGFADVRNVHMPQTPTLVLNNLFFSAEGRMRLSQTPEGRAYLIAATTVLVDQLGVRGRAEAGIVGENVGATVRVEGRLSNDSALLEDGSGRSASANLYWAPNKVLRISVDGTLPLETGTAPHPGLMGQLTVTE